MLGWRHRHQDQTAAAGGGEGFALERFEPRVLLSGEYYDHLTLDEIAGADLEWRDVVDISSGGELIWSWYSGEDDAFIASRSRVWRQDDLPLLADSRIVNLTDDGQILAHNAAADRYFMLDLDDPSTPRYFDEMDFEAPEDRRDGLFPRAYIENGDFLLQFDVDESTSELWLLRDGVAQRLWTREPNPVDHYDYSSGEDALLTDYTAESTLVGHATVGGQFVPVMWSAPTGLEVLHGLETVDEVNGDGLVIGKTTERRLAFWQAGVLTPTALVDDRGGMDEDWYEIQDIDNQGRVTIRHTDVNYKTNVYISTVTLEGGIVDDRLWSRVFNAHYEDRGQEPVSTEYRMSESGDLAYNGFLEPVPLDELLATQPGYPVALGVDPESVAVVTGGREAWQLVMRAGRDTVDDWSLAPAGASEWWQEFWEEPDVEVATYRNPRSGGIIIAMNDPDADLSDPFRPGGPRLIEVDPARGVSTGWGGTSKIQRGLTAFVSSDRRVHFAGLDREGDLVLHYEWSTRINGEDHWAFRFENMTETHLEPRGLTTPDFTGQLASFSTVWGGMNIVGLDTSGQVHAVWWSRSSHGWQLANLSDLADAPALTGPITATATPWGAMQIFGADAEGRLVGLWWSPTSHGWHTTDLTTLTDGLLLDASTLTVQMMPWGGISIVGKSAEGEVAAYWWNRNAGWASESISQRLTGDAPDIPGPVSYQATPDGTQHIAAVDAAGHVVDLYWLPDGNGWQWRDLTAMATG